MSTTRSGQVDLLKELRLRRWARENYVSANERKPSWHPLVLDEMRLKDAEIAQREVFHPGKRFVPLEPMPIQAIHPAHPAPGNPNVRFDGAMNARHAYAKFPHNDLIEDDERLFGLG
ncbi:MAG: hypothetical protein WEB58_21320 [Planctomycetaceae bacterium]